MKKVGEIIYMSHLKIPKNECQLIGGEEGAQTKFLRHLLTEIQFLRTKCPGVKQ